MMGSDEGCSRVYTTKRRCGRCDMVVGSVGWSEGSEQEAVRRTTPGGADATRKDANPLWIADDTSCIQLSRSQGRETASPQLKSALPSGPVNRCGTCALDEFVCPTAGVRFLIETRQTPTPVLRLSHGHCDCLRITTIPSPRCAVQEYRSRGRPLSMGLQTSQSHCAGASFLGTTRGLFQETALEACSRLA